jgi:DNA polymerase III alpha subunit
MRNDLLGQQILDEIDLCDLYLTNPDQVIKTALVKDSIKFDGNLTLDAIPKLNQYQTPTVSKLEFDTYNQSLWAMPKEYIEIDIAKWVLDQCKTDTELQRAGEELIKYQEREMFMLLRYLKYLVDTMRKHNVVWGVGRGSSVASYVLFLIGIHKINSLYYQLSIDEFLK